MTHLQTGVAPTRPLSVMPLIGFVAILVGGLFYVKWHPYFDRAFVAAARHDIGNSILGREAEASWHAGIAYSIVYLKAIWKALVLALAIAAGVQALLPRRWVVSLFSGRRSEARATVAALPSMMCTCCAAPIAVGMIESQASAAAAIAYWLANPVLNPATLVFIGFVLGWGWAALRLGLGAALVFVLSRSAARLLPSWGPHATLPIVVEGAPRHYLRAWLQAFWRLAIRLVPEYLVLVFLLGAARAWLFPALTPSIGHAPWLPPLLAFAGTLFVIPTAGEVPIIQTLQHLGLGAAGTGALLMTLPAVSVPSLVMLGRAVPARVLILLGAGTFGFGLLAALAASLLGLT